MKNPLVIRNSTLPAQVAPFHLRISNLAPLINMADCSQNVCLSIHLSTSSPHTISVSEPQPREPLRLIASIRQEQSPHPTRAITLLTTYTALDNTPNFDSIFWRQFSSPTSTADENRVIWMHARKTLTRRRISGDVDLRKRDDHTFITVPPLGQGEAQISFELSPKRLFRLVSRSVEDSLAQYQPGETFAIRSLGFQDISWWTWGALNDELKDKKFARWQLPLEPSNATDLASQLRDSVDLHDVNYLSSRSAVDDEEKPNVQEMKEDGWVFSEPDENLEVRWANMEEGAIFEFVE